MALTEFPILKKPRSGCLEDRMAPVQPNIDFFQGKQNTIADAEPALSRG